MNGWKRNTVRLILSTDMIENYKRNMIEEGTIREDFWGQKSHRKESEVKTKERARERHNPADRDDREMEK